MASLHSKISFLEKMWAPNWGRHFIDSGLTARVAVACRPDCAKEPEDAIGTRTYRSRSAFLGTGCSQVWLSRGPAARFSHTVSTPLPPQIHFPFIGGPEVWVGEEPHGAPVTNFVFFVWRKARSESGGHVQKPISDPRFRGLLCVRDGREALQRRVCEGETSGCGFGV